MFNITIIITRYQESNDFIKPCLEALSRQKNIIAKIYFLDQKYDNKIKKIISKLSNKNIKFIYKKIPAISLSYARNLGVKLSTTNIVLFIDCDAIPEYHWAYELSKVFSINENIAIVGGKSIPIWGDKIKWFCKSNIIKEIYSLIDISVKIISVNKIMGVNFGINKKVLKDEILFNENLGRRQGKLFGGEETELCRRVINNGLKVYYTPYAIVKHQIQKDRISLKWIIKRFFYAGYTRAILGGYPQPYSKQRNIYDYMFLIIIFIPYIFGYLKGKLIK